MPSGAVASEEAKEGKKKTIFLDFGSVSVPALTGEDRAFMVLICHEPVSGL